MISIIIPVYNSESTIRRCIDSLLCQDYKHYEILLIDDGSNDSSPTICSEYAQNYANICYVPKRNGGVSSARNTGLNIATGEWVTFCDNDDIVSPQWLSRMRDIVKADCQVLPMCAYTRNINELGDEQPISILKNTLVPRSDYITFYEQGIAGFVWNSLYNKCIIDQNRLRFTERKEIGDINEDLIFQLDYLRHVNAIVYTGFYDYCWTINETNHSNDTSEKYYFEKYREKYELLKGWISYSNALDSEQLSKLASMMLYHFIKVICEEPNYIKMKRMVDSPVVQECVRLADSSHENPLIIELVKKRQSSALHSFLRLSKIKNKLFELAK